MNERGRLAAIGGLLCAAAVGIIVAERVSRAPKIGRPHVPASSAGPPASLATPIGSVEPRSTALASVASVASLASVAPVAPVASAAAAPRPLTYETVPVGLRRRARASLTVAGAVAVLGGAGTIAFALVTPTVTALAAPDIAYPGTTAVISYAASGYGTLSYRLDARSGRRSGALRGGEGTFAVAVAPSDANSDIVFVIRDAGPLGSDARIGRIRVLPRPRAAVVFMPSNDVHIDTFSLSAANVASGDTIVVRYHSNATSGHVLLRDARGGLWQSVPLNRSGLATLRAPALERDAPFNVVLEAQHGGRRIENSLALVVSAPPARPPVAHTRSSVVTPDIPAVIRSGALLVTGAGAGRRDTVIELADRDGTSLQRASPGPDGTTELRMPVVAQPRAFLVSVSYRTGTGRESWFHWIRVLPDAIPRSE